MQSSLRLLSLVRPLVPITIIGWYLNAVGRIYPVMALLTISAGLFVATSAVVMGWIPGPYRWVRRAIWTEFATILTLVLVLSRLVDSGPAEILLFPTAVTIFLRLERREWPAASIATIAIWFIGIIPGSGSVPDRFIEISLNSGLLLFAIGAGVLSRNLMDERERSIALLSEVQNSRDALERSARQLQDSLTRQQELAVLEERQRLAREIHDGVAHSLTALVVQLQAARRLLERAPEQAAEIIGRCEETAREALTETRQAVRALHPAGLEQQSDLEALRRLGRDFGLATGMDVTVTADAAACDLRSDPARLEHLYRIFQECLTNAYRHGKARHVQTHLGYAEGLLSMRVVNDGVRPSNLDPGLGLRSMEERSRSLGGSLRVEPGETGLVTTVSVPVREEALP